MGTADDCPGAVIHFLFPKCSSVKLDSNNVDVLYSVFFSHHVTTNNVGSQLEFDASRSFHLLSLKTVVLSSKIPKIHPLEKRMYL